MQFPLVRLPAAVRGRLLTVSLVATLGLWGVSLAAGAPLMTAEAPAGIVSFELAGTLEQAEAMLNSWDDYREKLAAFLLGFDYLFLVAYATFFALACLTAGEAARAAGSRLAALAIPLAWGQWLAAGLDALENFALLWVVFDSTWSGWPPLAWFAASLKFALIGIALIYTIWGMGLRTMEDFLGRSV
ncbi:MAG TPA: hypothetical protein VNT75_01360 [Symbiobacteriaceae bacterium]|nr:hypothetical protein [Symbiobacteriaceae bacterium]